VEQDKVARAFAVIIQEIKATIEELNDQGAEAFRRSKYEEVDRLRKLGAELADFRDSVNHLQTIWFSKFLAGSDNSARQEPMQVQPPSPQPEAEPVKEGSGLLGRLEQHR
jgi:CRISPR/Cas system CMR-associated protein Cmr5 small subunit